MVANFDNQFECIKARGLANRIALHKQKTLDQAKIAKRTAKKANEVARAEYIKRRSLGKTAKAYDVYLSMANPNHDQEFETLKKAKVVKQAEDSLLDSEVESESEDEDSHVVFVAEAEPKVEQKAEEAEEWELL